MKKILIFIVFVAGYLIMSLELLGFRLLAPYFGASIYVWGSLIGLILMALAGGYYFGGWLSELYQGGEAKKGARFFLNKLFLLVAVFLLFDLFFYSLILKWLSSWDIIWGALAATLIIFCVPMLALAAISPLVIKILSEQKKTGYSAGLVYAWGTVGGILGTFLTTFYLIPYFGSRLTFYSCFFFVLIGLAVLILKENINQAFWCLLLWLVSLPFFYPPSFSSDVILERDSVYNHIYLIDTPKLVLLALNSQSQTIAQSGYVKNGTLVSASLIDLFNVGPLITPVHNLLILGMSGGISVRQFQQYFPVIKIEAVEIDPEIVSIAKEYFGVKENDNLKIFTADARPFLARSGKQYDMIEIDLFNGNPFIPFYALTQEFFLSVHSHLSEQGLMMMNIFTPGGRELFEPALATIKSVFPSVFIIPIGTNFVVVGTQSATDLETVKNKIMEEQKKYSADLEPVIRFTLNFISEYQINKKAPVFTDDWAPVEPITYKMVKGLRL